MTQAEECAHLERTHALADGELTGADADDAREHLATCAACQAELAEVLQLDAAVAPRAAAHRMVAEHPSTQHPAAEHVVTEHADVKPPAAERPAAEHVAAERQAQVVSLAWYRQRRVQVTAIALLAAACVVIFIALPNRGASIGPGPVAIALAPRRAVEARLSWSGAAAYRTYDVPRAGEPPHESIALTSLAELETRGDHQGVGVLALLNGDLRQAAAQLERAGDSAEVLSDRAALALAQHQPEHALALADAALTKAASHGAALWNRALALHTLGLSRAAAAAFRDVAARGEPGWTDEAQQRSAALDAETDALQHRFERINQAGVALTRDKIELSVDDARAMPGFARGILYDAIRAATTPAQLAALQPLGEAIDTADRGTAMADALARSRGVLHPALSARYGEMVRALAVELHIVPTAGNEPPAPSGAARTQLLAALRTAHADDLLIGVLLKLSPDRRIVDRAEIAEFARLTAASPDPWMQLLGLEQQVQVALIQDDRAGAEALLRRATQRCSEPGAPAFRCILIEQLRGELYLRGSSLPDARAALSVAWQAARASGEWVMRGPLLEHLASAASGGDQADATTASLARAYRDELARLGDAAHLPHPTL
jgi:cellulose synthase operon protein C